MSLHHSPSTNCFKLSALPQTSATCVCGFGLPRWLTGKESSCQYRRHGGHDFDPWSGKSLLEEMASHSSNFAWEIPWTEETSRHGFVKESQITEHVYGFAYALQILHWMSFPPPYSPCIPNSTQEWSTSKSLSQRFRRDGSFITLKQ